MLPFMRDENEVPKKDRDPVLQGTPDVKKGVRKTQKDGEMGPVPNGKTNPTGGKITVGPQTQKEGVGGIPFCNKRQNGNPELDTQEYVTIEARQKQVQKGTMLFVVLFVVGLFCLWFMIKKSAPQPAKAAADDTENTRIETAITRLTGVGTEMFNRMSEIVKKFYQFSDVQQVNVNELVKNPFELEMFLGGLENISDGSEPVTLNLGSQMQLLSIMRSEKGNCCMIDDTILYEGDSIRGFKVRRISDTSVRLESETLESPIILKLSD
jgi:hypothetical protein